MAEQHGSRGAKASSRPHLAGSCRPIRGHSLRRTATSGLLLVMSLGNIHFPSKPFIYLRCTLNILVCGAAVFDVQGSLHSNPKRSPPPPTPHSPVWSPSSFYFFWGGGGEGMFQGWFPKKQSVMPAKDASFLKIGCLSQTSQAHGKLKRGQEMERAYWF